LYFFSLVGLGKVLKGCNWTVTSQFDIMAITIDYLLVAEAADLLGVSPNTIRNWGP
jgi:hypothetical protein